jgi:phasin family protein
VAGGGARSLAEKQLEIVETVFHEAAVLVREFKPTGDPKVILAKQTEFARKVFGSAVQNTREVTELANRTTTDAAATIRDRLRESLSELGIEPRRTDG